MEFRVKEPEIRLIQNFVNDSEALFEHLETSVEWDVRMKARKTASFGVSYNYSGITYPQNEMPAQLASICNNINSVLGFLPNNCLLNYYIDGKSSMGYHSDSSEELLPGTGVAIISLGSIRSISYKNKANKEVVVKYPLEPGTLLYMDDQVQQNWLHAIPKEHGVGSRISLTFRHIIK